MTSVSQTGVVAFRFFRPNVNDVRVMGDFVASGDGSAPGGVAMTGSPDGWWHAEVALGAGEYRFRYVADGVFYADYAANGIELTKRGPNSVLVVPERRDQFARMTPVKMVA